MVSCLKTKGMEDWRVTTWCELVRDVKLPTFKNDINYEYFQLSNYSTSKKMSKKNL